MKLLSEKKTQYVGVSMAPEELISVLYEHGFSFGSSVKDVTFDFSSVKRVTFDFSLEDKSHSVEWDGKNFIFRTTSPKETFHDPEETFHESTI